MNRSTHVDVSKIVTWSLEIFEVVEMLQAGGREMR